MSKNEKRSPELRFKGFSDAWEQRKFDKLVRRVSTTSERADLPQIEYEDIISNLGKLNKDIHLKESNKKGIHFDAGDILFGKLRPYLNKWFLADFEGVAIGDFWVLRPYEIESRFIYYLIQTTKFKAVSNISTGTRMPRSDWNIVSNSEFYVPEDNKEAVKISRLIASLDHIVTLHQRKISIIKNLKQGYLSLMFADNEHPTPLLRFKQFKVDWKQRKLGDVGAVAMNRRIFKEETSDVGDVPFYKIGTFGKEPDAYISREKFEEYKRNYPFPEVGDILISASGSIGRTIEYNGEDAYYQDSNIVWLKHNGRINNLFLKQLYNIIKWSGVEGSTIKRLYNKNILNTVVWLPILSEQKEIGELMNLLDNTINFHQEKLNKLSKLKQIYLNKMFI